jgi:CDGSH-type Zn-finger protein
VLAGRAYLNLNVGKQGERNMTEAIRAADTPFAVDVEGGKVYFWCACGKSASQPFCDGSHADTSFVPLKYEAPTDKTVYFCGCKASGNGPLCDGSHKN